MMQRISLGAATLTLCLFEAGLLRAQTPPSGKPTDEKVEDGIPVADPLVVAKCGGCHKKDEKGNLSRISWERTTPEGWEEVIKRMVRLNGLTLNPEEARRVIKSLSSSHGLAPEEAGPVAYMPEHRIVQESFPNENMKATCASCHPFGRVASFRRSPDEWKRLADLHVALYPIVELTAFRRREPRAGAGEPLGDSLKAWPTASRKAPFVRPSRSFTARL